MGQLENIVKNLGEGIDVCQKIHDSCKEYALSYFVSFTEKKILVFTKGDELPMDFSVPGYTIGNVPYSQLAKLKPSLKGKGALLSFVKVEDYLAIEKYGKGRDT